MKTKTNKTPLLMAESDALSYWPITIVHESKLLHMATVHYGFVPKLSHHGGKTQKTTITMKDLKKRFLLLLCAVVSCGAAWAQESNVAWVKVTDYTNLSTNDTYVIAGSGISGGVTKWFSLKNNEVTSASTSNGVEYGSVLSLSDDINKINSQISEDETWKLEPSTTENAYYIKSTKGSFYLQSESSIGCKIKSKDTNHDNNNLWYIHTLVTDPDNKYSFTGLLNLGQTRALGVYYHKDWRSYGPSKINYINGEEVVLYRKVTSVPVNISSAKYASFCSSCPVDFSGTGITVYKAKGTESAVTLTRVEDGIVPANKGVVLYSESVVTNQNVPIATSDGTTDWSDNELIGITERTKISVNGAEGKTNYILSKEGNGVGFYLAASGDGAYLAANRAYLSTSASQQLVPQYLGFEEETTGVLGLTPTISQGEGAYDLSGRRVAQPKNGLYIVNGKKVYVK